MRARNLDAAGAVHAPDEASGGSPFSELVGRIEAAASTDGPVVVVISGFGGSGKTTLANRLRDHFGLSDRQVIRGDDLYSTNPHGRGLFDLTDWPLLTRILEDAQVAERLRYVGRDYRGDAVDVDEQMPQVVIVEGIRLLRSEAMARYDVAVWINCPHDIATRRAKARNREQGESEYEIALWDTLWGPLDDEYFRTHEPLELATFVYETDT